MASPIDARRRRADNAGMTAELQAARDVAPSPRRASRAIWLVALLAFAVGIVAMYALLPAIERWRSPPPAAVAAPVAPAPPPTVAAPTITTAAPTTIETLAAREAVLDAQLRQLEARMAAIDAASRTASGYATRAEGMMIAFAVRRALDRGMALGYVEGQLRERFGADEPQAVNTILAAAQAPVTREDLRLALDTIAPELTGGSTRDGVFKAIGRELSNLVVLRRESTPSPRPADRLTRARRLIDAGNVEAALAEVARMPGAADATSWITAAKRYIDARRALGAIELAAINGRTRAPTVPSPPAPLAPTANPAGLAPGG